MDALRRTHLFARFALLWFVLSVGIAAASPLVQPPAMELVCSSAGMVKLVVKNTNGDAGNASDAAQPRHLDCPLCLAAHAAPPPPAVLRAPPPQPLAYALQPRVAAHIAGMTAAPLPARGPPVFLS